jgi:hypothetical protein
MIPFGQICALCQHLNNVPRIGKRPYADAVSLVDDGHCPEANAPHLGALGEQKAVVNVVEELLKRLIW